MSVRSRPFRCFATFVGWHFLAEDEEKRAFDIEASGKEETQGKAGEFFERVSTGQKP